ESTCDEGRYWHSGLQQAFYFIVSGRSWSACAPRSFVGKPLMRWRNWIALDAQDIHDAVRIMDALHKACHELTKLRHFILILYLFFRTLSFFGTNVLWRLTCIM